jgi:hypothetical protein
LVLPFFYAIFTVIVLKMKRLTFLLTFILALTCSQYLLAAPPPPPAVKPPCWPPPCIPIDGGISALIAAGAAYGAKKLYDKKKKSSEIA